MRLGLRAMKAQVAGKLAIGMTMVGLFLVMRFAQS